MKSLYVRVFRVNAYTLNTLAVIGSLACLMLGLSWAQVVPTIGTALQSDYHVSLSPDGQTLAVLRPDDTGDNVLWLAPSAAPQRLSPIGHQQGRQGHDIVHYWWAYTSDHIILQSSRGALYSLHTQTGWQQPLVAKLTEARLERLNPATPFVVLISAPSSGVVGARTYYLVNLLNGEYELFRSESGFLALFMDDNFEPRAGIKIGDSGNVHLMRKDSSGAWSLVTTIAQTDLDKFLIQGLSSGGQMLSVFDQRQAGRLQYRLIDLRSGQTELRFEGQDGAVKRVLRHQGIPQALLTEQGWTVLDDRVAADMRALSELYGPNFQVLSRTLDDKVWLISDSLSGDIYRYARPTKRAELLMHDRRMSDLLVSTKTTPSTAFTGADALQPLPDTQAVLPLPQPLPAPQPFPAPQAPLPISPPTLAAPSAPPQPSTHPLALPDTPHVAAQPPLNPAVTSDTVVLIPNGQQSGVAHYSLSSPPPLPQEPYSNYAPQVPQTQSIYQSANVPAEAQGPVSAPYASQATPHSGLQTVPCSQFNIRDSHTTCGYISVPQWHNQPEGKQLELAVAIVRSTNPNPDPTPLVVENGGPGGSSIELLNAVKDLFSGIRSQRDMIAVEQRGTRFSRPHLSCHEHETYALLSLNQPSSADQKHQALRSCFERYTREGYDLSAFNSIQNALDISYVMQALSIPKIHLYGGSYGSMLVQHVMRQSPNLLSSTIMDPVVPLQINPFLEAPQSAQASLERVFQQCQANPGCNAQNPNLPSQHRQAVQTLAARPVPLTLQHKGQMITALLTPELFNRIIYDMLYVEFDNVPPTITQVARGNPQALSHRVIPNAVTSQLATSSGMYPSVLCAEENTYRMQDVQMSPAFPQFSKAVANTFDNNIPELCAAWPVQPLTKEVNAPIQSPVPTLMFAGAYDPISPPSFAERLKPYLPNGYLFTFPNTGHSTLVRDGCAVQIATAFLQNPHVQPSAGCMPRQYAFGK